jgi:hypothetical protein
MAPGRSGARACSPANQRTTEGGAHAQEVRTCHRRRPTARGRCGGHVGRFGRGAEHLPAPRLGKPSASNAAAATAAAEAAAKAKDVTRLVLIARFVEETFVDVPPVGEFNPGDTRLFTEDAFTPGGRLVGHGQTRFTGTFRQEVFVEATLILQGRGQIVVEGIVNFTEQRPALAVVGGTGEFRNARGQMFVLPGPTPEETKLVFALLL